MSTDLYISWSEYHQKIEGLAVSLYRSGWQFNQIVCIAKGGLRLGDTLCRLFRQPLAILVAASYHGLNSRSRGEIAFSQQLATLGELNDRVLLVDDLADSGTSLIEATRWLKTHHGDRISELRTAVIWYKGCSAILPDYYVDYLPDNPWIHQPFERYEQLTAAELAAQSKTAVD
ncbi:MAG: phosphoribosyltransferase [Chloroflexaceae bacterium]|nr:phosphoribosyltransferase [Chloroflexaceae bacterium]